MTSKDDDEGESIKVSSRKADKKTNRALAILKNDTGIIESNNPTSIIFVCNAGKVMEQLTVNTTWQPKMFKQKQFQI